MGILDFLTPEAGQRRRKWLNSQEAKLSGALDYALGPQAAPTARQAAGVLDMLNPVTGVAESMQGARQAYEGEGWDRVQGLGRMASGVAATVAPMAGKADDAAKLIDALLGWSPTRQAAGDTAGRFAADESGAIKAFHGSPHDFDRFSMDKIGTGEGAQAYGHGLYFAENEGVAKAYRDRLTPALLGRISDAILETPGGIHNDHAYAISRMIDDIVEKEGPKALDGYDPPRGFDDAWNRGVAAAKEGYDATRGRMYEVNIHANPEDFLDWDKPLSEQGAAVRAYAEARRDKVLPGRDIANMDGDMLWKMSHPQSDLDGRAWLDTGPAEDASARLHDAGIPGIKYLDQGSRGAGDGSRNYVVFDDSIIEIVKKFGIAAAAPMLGMTQADVAAFQQEYGT